MAYLAPTEFVTKMIDAGESKIFMSTRDTLIRSSGWEQGTIQDRTDLFTQADPNVNQGREPGAG